MSNTQISTHVVPEHMRGDGVQGTEQLGKYTLPPRLLIIQPTSKPPLNKHDAGTVLLMPGETVLAPYDKVEQCSSSPLLFVPIYGFTEFTIDNPMEIHASHGRVRERTFDATHDIALRAQSRDSKAREFPCPERPDKMCRYVIRLNYVWWLLSGGDEPINSTCFVSFKRAEANSARNLNTLVMSRKAPLYGCVFAASVVCRSNTKGLWYGFNITNPPKGIDPWVQNKELYESLKKAHNDAAEAHQAQLFELDDDTEETEVVSSDY